MFDMQYVVGASPVLVRRGLLGSDLSVTRTLCSPGSSQPREKGAQEVALGLYHRLIALGQALGRGIRQQASSTAKTWWDRYEEFVGLSEVREAQGKVTEAERAFMVARGLVREARETWEGQQDKLKEVRDRLDRISREDSQYLELATQEHRLLQVGASGAPSPPGRDPTWHARGPWWEPNWSGGRRAGEEAARIPAEGLGPRLWSLSAASSLVLGSVIQGSAVGAPGS